MSKRNVQHADVPSGARASPWRTGRTVHGRRHRGGGGGRRATGRRIGRDHHRVQRPARADDPGAGQRVREEDRHRCQRPFRRRRRARRPDGDRRRPFAGRRVLHRELAAAAVPGLQAPARPDQGFDAGPDAGEVQLAERHVGRGLGPGERHGVQPVAGQGEPAAHLGHAAGPSRSGRARSPSRGARPTSNRS